VGAVMLCLPQARKAKGQQQPVAVIPPLRAPMPYNEPGNQSCRAFMEEHELCCWAPPFFFRNSLNRDPLPVLSDCSQRVAFLEVRPKNERA
jgi:hypothetical protein